MARVSISTMGKALPGHLPTGFTGTGESLAMFGKPEDPIRTYVHRLRAGEELRITGPASDCSVFVWEGEANIDTALLPRSSSVIVQAGAETVIRAVSAPATLISFADRDSSGACPAGGPGVYALPADYAPRMSCGTSGVRGTLHPDASSPTCRVWLHENRFPAMAGMSRTGAEAGIHSHSEDEVIFVTEGQIRLGARLYGAGTAIAIAAETLYSFTPGPEGMAFINFRAGRPGNIKFKNGAEMDEVAYWREGAGSPQFRKLS